MMEGLIMGVHSHDEKFQLSFIMSSPQKQGTHFQRTRAWEAAVVSAANS
jgi:hypothetical protein